MAKVLQLLRNLPIYTSRSAAITALESSAFLTDNRKDGEIVIGRYTENGVFGLVLGIVHVDGSTKHIQILEDAATVEAASLSNTDDRPATIATVAKLKEAVNTSLGSYQKTLTAGNGINITNDNTIEVNLDGNFMEVVTKLPSTGETNKIYLVAETSTGTNNLYTEYIWKTAETIEVTVAGGQSASKTIAAHFEKLGEYNAEVDLSEYLKTADANFVPTDNIDKDNFTDSDSYVPSSKLVKGALSLKFNADDVDKTSLSSSTTKVPSSSLVSSLLSKKQDELTFDPTPTANSTNPVTSGGVKSALGSLETVISTHIAKRITSTTNIVISEPRSVTMDSTTGASYADGATLDFGENAVWDCGTYNTSAS